MCLDPLSIPLLFLVATVPAIVSARQWNVEWKSGIPSPQVLKIYHGDTVIWLNNDSSPHPIVETQLGARSCNPRPGGFNSGRRNPGQPWQRTFVQPTTVNYKDGMLDHCIKGGQGIIVVQHR